MITDNFRKTVDAEGLKTYDHIRSGGAGFYELRRGLIAVWGKEAVQFLDGMITNNMKTLSDGEQMLAAFPNAQGRLLAIVRILRQGERFLIDTEEPTREKVFQNLFRFTFAGDFFVEDLTADHRAFQLFGSEPPALAGGLAFSQQTTSIYFVPAADADVYREYLRSADSLAVSDALYETLRIENGIPKYGVDVDETTVCPEVGLDTLISYNKGCYIGQEIIARIHFRGHVAKKLTGLIVEGDAVERAEMAAPDGKNAGKMTSITFSPKLSRTIALGLVRYDYLAAGTELLAGDQKATVTDLPFITL